MEETVVYHEDVDELSGVTEEALERIDWITLQVLRSRSSIKLLGDHVQNGGHKYRSDHSRTMRELGVMPTVEIFT